MERLHFVRVGVKVIPTLKNLFKHNMLEKLPKNSFPTHSLPCWQGIIAQSLQVQVMIFNIQNTT